MTQSQIFPPVGTQTTNVSAAFSVENGVGVLRIDGWTEGDFLYLETQVGPECDNSWIPVIFCCQIMKTSAPSTHFLLPIPGRYRAVLSNTEDLHLTDATHFEDTKIYFNEYVVKHDISSFFQLCC